MAELVFDQKQRIGNWVARQVEQTSDWGGFYAMGVTQGDEVIAGVVINNFNGANATCHIAIAKHTKLIVPLFEAVCDYAFRQCGLKRLTGMVPTNEPHIIQFDKHLGFEEEFVMKDGAPGADMQILVMWPDTCRWLRKE
jgi:RimJ/RimL family protein N-acetyltransferase